MYKSRKRLVVLCIGILVVLGMWMMVSVRCWAAETDNDKEQPQMAKQDNLTQQETKKIRHAGKRAEDHPCRFV